MNQQSSQRGGTAPASVATLAGAAVLCGALGAQAAEVQVKIENLAPQNGLFFTPVWVGFHDGSFDLYDRGAPATAALERLTEDGETGPISAAFATATSGAGQDDTITAPTGIDSPPVFDPGESVSRTFDIDPITNRYFSFASMVVPSNDAFIANGDPFAHKVFEEDGSFAGKTIITILGGQILDAGTEVNNELDAAFINQAAPDTGLDENGVVEPHPGFIGSVAGPDGESIILGGTNGLGVFFDPVAADFTVQDQVLARITITPEPAGATVFGLASGVLLLVRRRTRRAAP